MVLSLDPPCLPCTVTDRKVKLFAAVTHVTVHYASILLVAPQCGHERDTQREREFSKVLNTVTTWYLATRRRWMRWRILQGSE